MSQQPQSLQPFRVLLIDTDESDARFIFEALKTSKTSRYEIAFFPTLEEGRRYLEGEGADIILIDIGASSCAPDDFVKFVETVTTIPVVALLDKDEEALSSKCIEAGAQDCIIKEEISNAALLRSVRFTIERFRTTKKLRETAQGLESAEGSLRNILEENNQAVVIVDMDGVVRFVNKASELLFGRSREGLEGEMFEFSVAPNKTTEIQVTRADGSRSLIEMRAIAAEWEGQVVYMVTLYDISELVRIREDMRSIGLIDGLTALYSRKGLLVVGEELFKQAKGLRKGMHLIRVDFANIAEVNKAGPYESEAAIVDVARLLKVTFSASSCIARIKESRFVAFIQSSNEQAAQPLLAKLQDNVRQQNESGRHLYRIELAAKALFCNPSLPISFESLFAQLEK